MTPSAHDPVSTHVTVWWLDDATNAGPRPQDNPDPIPATGTTAGGATARLRLPATATESATAPAPATEPTSASATGWDPTTPPAPLHKQRASRVPERFLWRLSRQLVLTYTTAADVVVDLHGYTGLQQAAADTGRTYLHLADPTRIADLDRRSTPTSLVLTSLPDAAGSAQLNDLLLACRLIMTGDRATLAMLLPIAETATTLSPGHRLRAAATRTGLRTAGTILALHNPGHGNRYLYSVTPEQAHALHTAHPTHTTAPVLVHLYTAENGLQSG